MDKKRLFLIAFCIFLPLFLLLFSYKGVLLFSVFTADQENTIGYLNNKEELKLDYTQTEISHLEDVKKVMLGLDIFFYLALLAITLIWTYCKKDKLLAQKLLFYGGIASLVLPLLVLIASLISFNASFTAFHQIFFPQGNWSFPADSLLIRTFPLEFFVGISQKIFLTALFFGSLFILISLYLKYVNRPRA